MLPINKLMKQRVSDTFQWSGGLDIGKKHIMLNTQQLEVDIEYVWIANISDYSNKHYGITIIQTDKGIFGAYIVPELAIENDATIYDVVRISDQEDPLYDAMSNTTLFPTYFQLDWGSGIRCQLHILTPAIIMDFHIDAGRDKDPMVEKFWNALQTTHQMLFATYAQERQKQIRENLFVKYKHE